MSQGSNASKKSLYVMNSFGKSGKYQRTTEQDKTTKRIESRTRDLKNEQFRLIDESGNVTLEKRGDGKSVKTKASELREFGRGAVAIHNHPVKGGTFSEADLQDFAFGVKEIVAVAPEGTYRLINNNYNKKEMYDGWMPLRDAMASVPRNDSEIYYRLLAQEELKNSMAARQIKAISKRWSDIREKQGRAAADEYYNGIKDKFEALQKKQKDDIDKRARYIFVNPEHEFLKKNAKKYGFTYVYEKKNRRKSK